MSQCTGILNVYFLLQLCIVSRERRSANTYAHTLWTVKRYWCHCRFRRRPSTCSWEFDLIWFSDASWKLSGHKCIGRTASTLIKVTKTKIFPVQVAYDTVQRSRHALMIVFFIRRQSSYVESKCSESRCYQLFKMVFSSRRRSHHWLQDLPIEVHSTAIMNVKAWLNQRSFQPN